MVAIGIANYSIPSKNRITASACFKETQYQYLRKIGSLQVLVSVPLKTQGNYTVPLKILDNCKLSSEINDITAQK